MRGILRSAVGIWLPLSACLLPLTCSDNGTGPPVDTVEYIFYMSSNDAGAGGAAYYRYHSLRQFVDTVYAPTYASLLEASLDGETFYLGGSHITVCDDSLRRRSDLAYDAQFGISVSPNGKYLGLCGYGVVVLSTSDYSVVWSDTVGGIGGAFSSDSRSFYYSEVDAATGNGQVAVLSCLQGTITRTVRDFPGKEIDVIPSPDEQRWYVYTRLSWDVSAVLVYDVSSDSIVNSVAFSPGMGDMALTKRGDRLFFTNHGTPQIGTPPPWEIYYYDVGNARFGTIPVVGAVTSEGDTVQHMVFRTVAVSPDDRYLVATGERDANIAVYDLQKNKFLTCYHISISSELPDIACKLSK